MRNPNAETRIPPPWRFHAESPGTSRWRMLWDLPGQWGRTEGLSTRARLLMNPPPIPQILESGPGPLFLWKNLSADVSVVVSDPRQGSSTGAGCGRGRTAGGRSTNPREPDEKFFGRAPPRRTAWHSKTEFDWRTLPFVSLYRKTPLDEFARGDLETHGPRRRHLGGLGPIVGERGCYQAQIFWRGFYVKAAAGPLRARDTMALIKAVSATGTCIPL